MRKCFICNKTIYLERHHIFGAANRKKSEKYGLVVDLCYECHRTSKTAVHNDAKAALKLHQYGQRKFMHEHNIGIDGFRGIFGKNYL